MAAVRTDRLDVPSGTHDERVLVWTRVLARRLDAMLAGADPDPPPLGAAAYDAR